MLIRVHSCFILFSLSLIFCWRTEAQETSPPSPCTYSTTFHLFKDFTSWEQDFTYHRSLGKKFSLSSESELTKGDEKTLCRKQEGGKIGLTFSYLVTPQIILKTVLEGRASREQSETYKNVTRRNSLSAELSYQPVKWLILTETLGRVFDQYQREEKREEIETITYNEGKLETFSLVLAQEKDTLRYLNSSQIQTVTSQREQNISASFAQPIFHLGRLQLEVGKNEAQRDYPLEDTRETKRQNRTKAQASFKTEKFRGIIFSLSTNLANDELKYSLTSPLSGWQPKDTKSSEINIISSLIYQWQDHTTFKFNFRRGEKKSTFKRTIDDETVKVKDFSASLNYKEFLDFRYFLYLAQYDFPHRYNFNAHDLYQEETTAKFSLPSFAQLRINILLGVRQNKLVYVKPEMSANTKKNNIYELTPQIQAQPLKSLNLQMEYSLRADYTFYEFKLEDDFLLRSASAKTQLKLFLTPQTTTTLEHLFLTQDQGAYFFNPSTKRREYWQSYVSDRNNFDLAFNFKPSQEISLSLLGGIHSFHSNETKNIEKSLTGNTEYSLGRSGVFRFSGGKTFRSPGKDFWEIQTSLEYKF